MPGSSAGGIPIPLDTDPVGDGALAVRNLAAAIGDPWTAYNAIVQGWTRNNGTVTAAYRLIGRTVLVRIAYTVGSTDVKAGALGFTLPADVHANWAFRTVIGSMHARNSGSTVYAYRNAYRNAANTVLFCDDSGTNITNTVPTAWDTGSYFHAVLCYEAA